MDCHQAQAQFELANRGKDAVRSAEAVAAEQHLAECDLCQLVTRSQQRFDDQVARAIGNVPLPEGLTQRLHAAIGAAATPVPQSTAKSPRRQFLQRAVWGTLAAAGLLACALLLPRTTVLNDASIRELGKLDLTALPAGASSAGAPPGWNSQRSIQFSDTPRMATVGGHEIPLLTFRAQTDRRPSALYTGFLIRLPHAQWHEVPEANSIGKAQVQYASFGTWVAWREGDSVIICVLHGDAHAMQRLQEIVTGSRQLT